MSGSLLSPPFSDDHQRDAAQNRDGGDRQRRRDPLAQSQNRGQRGDPHVGLEPEGDGGQETGRAMLEAFVEDMDDACRRLGIGDMGVPRHVKKAAAAVLERGNAYRAAMADSTSADALATVLASAIWQEPAERARGAVLLAEYVRRAVASLERQAGAGLLAGSVDFPAPQPG